MMTVKAKDDLQELAPERAPGADRLIVLAEDTDAGGLLADRLAVVVDEHEHRVREADEGDDPVATEAPGLRDADDADHDPGRDRDEEAVHDRRADAPPPPRRGEVGGSRHLGRRRRDRLPGRGAHARSLRSVTCSAIVVVPPVSPSPDSRSCSAWIPARGVVRRLG